MSNAIAFSADSELAGASRFRSDGCRRIAGARSRWLDTSEALRVTTEIMKHILPTRRSMIPSSFVVRALAHQGQRYACANCGEQMFVRYDSGLCPLCYNGRRPLRGVSSLREVPHSLALAGVLDDPMLDELENDERSLHTRPHSFAARG
jgi:hypothetical protein